LSCTARADDATLFLRRYRREEMKIQAWENRRRQKAELEMKMTEVRMIVFQSHDPADVECRQP